MNEMIKKRNALLSAKVIKGLESRNMTGYYAETKEEALKIALSLIPEGCSVTMGGAMSAHEIGRPRDRPAPGPRSGKLQFHRPRQDRGQTRRHARGL